MHISPSFKVYFFSELRVTPFILPLYNTTLALPASDILYTPVLGITILNTVLTESPLATSSVWNVATSATKLVSAISSTFEYINFLKPDTPSVSTVSIAPSASSLLQLYSTDRPS